MNHTTNVLDLRCEPLPVVRIALIGVGNRGMKTLQRYAFVPNAEICYMADIDSEALERANAALEASGRPCAMTLCGADAWQEACQRTDVDLVYICTDWQTHASMAIYGMLHGKHVAVEVPAATSVEECRLLVETAEATRRHCFMAENCCYDFFALNTYEMNRRGMFGKIVHCEGAYIHNLGEANARSGNPSTGHLASWIEKSYKQHGGNPYPTHGIGPIAKLLGFHKADRMENLVSLTSTHDAENTSSFSGNINSSLIRTTNGVTILLQLDVTTPRPYSRLQTICGTNGFAQKYPLPTVQIGDSIYSGRSALDFMDCFAITTPAQQWKQGIAAGVDNAMNYVMDIRLIQALHLGLPLDIDVYDAAEWSCLAELTRLSASNGGQPIEIPDFLSNKIR